MTKHGGSDIKIFFLIINFPNVNKKVEFNIITLRMSWLKRLLLKVYNNIKMFMIVVVFLLKYILFKQCKIRHSKTWETDASKS